MSEKPKSRLSLDFQLTTKEERVNYVRRYLDAILFKPTQAELDTIAKYILWGKDPFTGLNGRQEGLELETRYKTWDAQKLESLDALIESPSFSEATLRRPSDPPTRIPRETFSRARARKSAPPNVLAALETLWREIDETELVLNLYELSHNKRSLPPRTTLLDRFQPSEIASLTERASHISAYTYIKLKHELVELRREQYTLKDEYSAPILSNPTFNYVEDTDPLFGADIVVLPIGIPSGADSPLYSKIFNPDRYPIPSDFSAADLSDLSALLWRTVPPQTRYFDFTNTDHLYRLFEMWTFLEESAAEAPFDSTLPLFMRAASMYRTLAMLDPIQQDILDLKIQKKSNQDILEYVNPKYGKTYKPNYISTLYCKKCLALIARAAKRHREVLENIFFPENFKKCRDCGTTLLIDEENFVRRHRSKDGFSPRCKRCEKARRDAQK